MPKVECKQCGKVVDETETFDHYQKSYVLIAYTVGEHQCFSFKNIKNPEIVLTFGSDAEDGVKRIHWQKYCLTEVIDEGFIPPK